MNLLWDNLYSRRTRIDSVIGDIVLNNSLKAPLFRETKNFFVKTALICILQHTNAIAQTLQDKVYQTYTA